jgi:hypothetical protein
MPKLVTERFDAQKLRMVTAQIRRAEMTLDALVAAMEADGIQSLNIAGAAELARSLRGIASFGEFGHVALRDKFLDTKPTVPGADSVSPKSNRSVGVRATGKKKKRPVNNGT